MASCCLHTRSARALLNTAARALGGGTLLALLAAMTMVGTAHAATAVPTPAGISFNGDFQRGISSWTSTTGGAQCANYGTPPTAPRARGNLYVDPTTVVGGLQAARIDLPASTSTDPLQACELTHSRPLGLGTDDYYGYSFYVPKGWTDGTASPAGFWGIATAQFHFQNIWGSPLGFELHTDHMTLSVETGACNNHLSARPGCQYISNADAPNGNPGNLGAQYVVPPGMQTGVWHEIVMHVHWAGDSTGQIQIWHRVKGDPTWAQTVNLNGIPTVQWDVTQACCTVGANDKIGAYRGPSTAAVSVWLGNLLIGSSFNSVAALVGQPQTIALPASPRPLASQTKLAKPPPAHVTAKAAAKRRHARACRIQRAADRRRAHHRRRHHPKHHPRVLRCRGNFR